MKKLISLPLAILLAAMTMVPASAVNKPVGTKELTNLEVASTAEVISLDLSASEAYSEYEFTTDSLTADQIADLADLKYGVSLIGVTGLERGITGFADGVYSTGNSGGALLNGKKSLGAGSWYTKLGTYYNAKGESGQADSIYFSLLTYNFGRTMYIDSFAFLLASNFNGCPQAGDIYVSDDGTTWTYVGSWDRVAKRMAGTDYAAMTDTPVDSLGKAAASAFGFEIGVNAQYLRFAFTASQGITSPASEDYEAYCNAESKSIAVREIMVWGSAAKAVETTTAAPETTKAPTTAPETTKAPTTTKAPEATPSTLDSTATLSLVVAAAAVCAVALLRRRNEA